MPTERPRIEQKRPKQLVLGFEEQKPRPKEKINPKLLLATVWLGANFRVSPAKIKKHCLPLIPKIKALSDELKSIANQQYMLDANRVPFNEKPEFERDLGEDKYKLSRKINELDPVSKTLLELLYNENGEPTLFNKILTQELDNRSQNDFSPEESFLNALYKLDIAYLDGERKDNLPVALRTKLFGFLRTLSKID